MRVEEKMTKTDWYMFGIGFGLAAVLVLEQIFA